MLINTVILFLRDALPIFILLALLCALLPRRRIWASTALISGFLVTLLYTNQIDSITGWFDGTGIELSLWLLHSCIYLLTLILGFRIKQGQLSQTTHVAVIAGIMVGLIMIAKGSSFLLYFSGYLHHNNALQSMLMGTLLGLGICLSLAVLIYFIVQWLGAKFGTWSIWFLLLLYATGQVVNAIPLLVQVDIVEPSITAWSTRGFISNESEFGHLFNVLFGYQATPSVTQVTIFIFALLCPLFTFWLCHKPSKILTGETQ
jgi:high-affinity iron transporter